MKLIRIGSSNKCDIVLHSPFVSAIHAEITILNNGELLLEDKGSTNGTFIGEHRISPNKENKILYGDKIRFADQALNWQLIPKKENLGDCSIIVNIGSHHRNDIVISEDPYASRYHAMFYIKGGKAYIRDCGSVNPTTVNGVKVEKNKDAILKRGDVVVCGQTDISSQLRQYIPNKTKWVKWVGISVGLAAVMAGIIYALRILLPGEVIDPIEMKSSVVYVQTYYHYSIKFEDNPIPEYWDGEIDLVNDVAPLLKDRGVDRNIIDGIILKGGQATAFFIDREGHLGTNRHVAVPWEYNKESDYEIVKRVVELYMSIIFPEGISKTHDLQKLMSTELGKTFVKAVENSNRRKDAVALLDGFVKRIQDSKITLVGKMDHILVGFPGRNYTHTDEFQRCSVVADSKDKQKDIAILEMNDKKTPTDIKNVFDVMKFRIDKLEPLKETFYTIGYPNGIAWAMDENTHSLEPAIRELKCSKSPSVYDFEFDGETIGGASGSPIFTKEGELVGIVWGGWSAGKTFGLACHAKWLKKLYEEEVLGK